MPQHRSKIFVNDKDNIYITLANKCYLMRIQRILAEDISTFDDLHISFELEGCFFDGNLPIVLQQKDGSYILLQPIETWFPDLLLKPFKYILCVVLSNEIDKNELENIETFVSNVPSIKQSKKPEDAIRNIYKYKKFNKFLNTNYKKISHETPTSRVSSLIQFAAFSPSKMQDLRDEANGKPSRHEKMKLKKNNKKKKSNKLSKRKPDDNDSGQQVLEL